MKIYKVKSIERKGRQQRYMLDDCIYDWRRLNNADYKSYEDIMNMKTRIWNQEEECSVATSYHFNPNKW